MNKLGITFILVVFGIYLTFALISIHRPLQADETCFPSSAEQAHYDQLDIGHPPLYQDSLSLMVKFLGLRDENLRLFGIFCFMLTLYLIYLIGKQISPTYEQGRNIGLLACFIYATHPMVIQGSLLVDIDTTILVVALTLFILFFLKLGDNLTLRGCFLLGLLFFICLWSKLSAPLVLIPSIFLFYILKGRIREGLVKLLLISLVGGGLFCIIWIVYAYYHHLPLLCLVGRIAHPLQRGLGSIASSLIPELIKRSVRIILWINPFLLLLALVILIIRFKEYVRERIARPIDFCLIYVFIIFFGYSIVSGTLWSFPKYHYHSLPILALVAAEIINKLNLKMDRKSLILYGGCALLFILYNLTVVGDLIYQVNYNLRNLHILAPERLPGAAIDFLWQLCFYFIPLPLGFLAIKASRRNYSLLKVTILSLFIALISTNISLNIMQAKGDYSSSYCYGRSLNNMRQLEQLFQKLNTKNPEGLIIGPEDVIYNAGLGFPLYDYGIIGKNSQSFLEAIKDERVICVVYGISYNSISFYRNVQSHKLVREHLLENYEFRQMGEYSVWLRKDLLNES